MTIWSRLKTWISADGNAALITILSVEGSAPREAGTRMIMRSDGRFSGTIGGGALEWQVLAEAQTLLARHPSGAGKRARYALGPALGQCCGGRVDLGIEVFSNADLHWIDALAVTETRGAFSTEALPDARGVMIRHAANPPTHGTIEQFGTAQRQLFLFGGGHVGRALVMALAPLPFEIRWIDGRPDIFPEAIPPNVQTETAGEPALVFETAPPDAFILAMTHSHALDLAIMNSALKRSFPYIGVIGSSTKRARFVSRLLEAGHDSTACERMICPIGLPAIRSKHPAMIAAGVAADLLIRHEALSARTSADISEELIHVRA